MKKATLNDLTDLTIILEDFNTTKEKMSESDLIDLAARLKPAAKTIEKIDEYVKGRVKDRLKHKEGYLNGSLFRAVLSLVSTTRFEQKIFKESHPKMYDNYTRDDIDERISFEAR